MPKAVVGITRSPLKWIVVFCPNCPIGEEYCLHKWAEEETTWMCPHFIEVETVDFRTVVKCDRDEEGSCDTE